MSISKNIKKLLVAGAAIIMAASAGANLNNVNAKRRSRYHYRTHHIYRKHAKRGYKCAHRSYRHARKHTYRRRRARRHVYRRRGRVTGKRNILTPYIYHINIHNTKELENMSSHSNISVQKLIKKYAKNGKINALNNYGSFYPLSKATIKDMELDNGDNSIPELIRDHVFSRGPVHYIIDDGILAFYTKDNLKSIARENHMSVSAYLHKYQKHPSKWWHDDGSPTKAALQVGERDAVNDLNHEREAQGIHPLIQDPTLEFIANKRIQLWGNGTEPTTHSWHTDKNGNSYADDIANKYNIPYDKASNGENIAPYSGTGYETPTQIASDENSGWDSAHQGNRDSAAYNYVGIGIGSGGGAAGGAVEEFR